MTHDPSTTPPGFDWSLALRYLSNAATPEERRQMDHWLADAPERQAYLASLQEMTNTVAAGAAYDGPMALHALHDRLDTYATASSSVPPLISGGHRRAINWWVSGVAACLLAAIGVGLAALRHVSHPLVSPYVSAPGQRLSVTLADGTRMTLAPGSTARLSNSQPSGGRQIALTGEAYFTVVHDPIHPFVVHTENSTTTDIGTAFDIRAYPEDRDTRVAVAEGQVSVVATEGSQSMMPVMLTAGHVADVSGQRIVQRSHIDVQSLVGWQQGRLVFAEAPLPQVVRDVARAMDLKITLTDSSLAAMTFTGSFDNVPVDQVLTIITQAIGAHYDRHGRDVTIRRGGKVANVINPPSLPAMQTALVHSSSTEQ